MNDFVGLKKGDVVIQNGSGVVGEAVVQMAKERGLKTVSVVKGFVLLFCSLFCFCLVCVFVYFIDL